MSLSSLNISNFLIVSHRSSLLFLLENIETPCSLAKEDSKTNKQEGRFSKWIYY